jgi:thiamine biosynthesis lipoprotein ApbE
MVGGSTSAKEAALRIVLDELAPMFDKAEELNHAMQGRAEELRAISAEMTGAKAELAATVDAARRELVTAHRELAKLIRDAKADHGKAGGALTASVHRAVADGTRYKKWTSVTS